MERLDCPQSIRDKTYTLGGCCEMLAKLHVMVPFDLNLLLGEEYKVYAYEQDGYGIMIEVPSSSGKPASPEMPEHVRINGKSSVQADVLNITFRKESFTRELSLPIDPPELLIQSVLKSFLERLKYVAKAPQVKLVNFPHCPWRLRYLNDDGSELEQIEGLIRGRGALTFGFSYIGCDPALWDLIFSLPGDFEAPAWHTLLVDSRGALPYVGTAIVLAATALEVFIAEHLDHLVKLAPVPEPLWNWINDRGNWQKEPSVEEQFDTLLKILSGHSLKEDNSMWEGLRNLRSARNSFVHHGVAKLGNKPISVDETLQLLERADQIVTKIREWIPEDCRWPVFQHTIQLEIVKVISPPTNSEAPATGVPVI